MDKNTIWAVVVSCVVLIAFMFIQTRVMKPKSGTDVPDTEAQVEQSAEVGPNSFPLLKQGAKSIPDEIIKINTDIAYIELTNKGGDIIKYELLDHKDRGDNIKMADSVSDTNRACAISFGTPEKSLTDGIINDNFRVTKIDDLTYLFENEFDSTDSDGNPMTFTLQKKYTFHKNDNLFQLDVTFLNADGKTISYDDAAYTLRSSPQIGPHYDRKKDRYENRTFIAFTKEKAKKQTVKDNQYRIYDKPYTWAATTGKYFAFIIVPKNPDVMGNLLYSRCYNNHDEKYPDAQVMMKRNAIKSSVTDTYYIYAGPKTAKDLKKYNKPENNDWGLSNIRIDETLNTSGLLSWLEIAMKWCMEMIYKLIPNWGIAIIIMTIILKFAMFPLTRKSQLSSLKMQEAQPRMQELQTKYKDNPQKMNEEMSKLYKEIGYNPMSGCLPLLIQFPLLMAMYNLFNNYFEFRGAMFIPGWIPDLSVGDSVYSFKFNIPFIGSELRILPFIYLATQMLYGVITNNGGATAASGPNAVQMKIMTYAMPVLFFFMFYNAPSGLILYWTVANIFTMVQQVILNNTKKRKQDEAARIKANTVPKFVPNKKKKKKR